MEPDNSKASRQSLDSAHSTTPLVQHPIFKPPPNYPELHGRKGSHDTATNIRFVVVILIWRILAFIAALSIAISLAFFNYFTVSLIFLVIFIWISILWNGFMVISSLRKSSFRLSLVLSDGRVISFGPGSEQGGRPRRCCSATFWVDFLLFTALFTLNLVTIIHGRDYYRLNLHLNWLTIAFQLIVTLLMASPALVNAHIRLESTETPQILLP